MAMTFKQGEKTEKKKKIEFLRNTIPVWFAGLFGTWRWRGAHAPYCGKQSFALHRHKPKAGDADILADQ